MIELITIIVLLFGIINIIRLAIFMVAADVYDVKNRMNFRGMDATVLPWMTVLIPAFNEQLTIEKTVKSVIDAAYSRKEIIVIDDGSTDHTSGIVEKLIARNPRVDLKLIRQDNAGKGAALNRGIKTSKGELIMVLDADSTIATDALYKSIKYFSDPKVKAVASSVGLRDNGKWLGLVQRMEYLIAHRLKRSLTALNIEYIIGGAGSIYRASTLKQVFGYRKSTITEDIDLSLKVVARGNKQYRVIFGSDIHAKTEAVHSLKELIKQRYRWKLGRLQSFVRYRHLFFSKDKKYSKSLTWYQLPYALFGELFLLIEPLLIGAIAFVVIFYGDYQSLLTAMTILSVYMMFNIIAEENETISSKLAMIYLLPVIYLMMPILLYVELVALLKSLYNWQRISPNYKGKGHWQHVKRQAAMESS